MVPKGLNVSCSFRRPLKPKLYFAEFVCDEASGPLQPLSTNRTEPMLNPQACAAVMAYNTADFQSSQAVRSLTLSVKYLPIYMQKYEKINMHI